MDIRVGEKVSGVISEVKEGGFTVALCNDITGFVPKENLADEVQTGELTEGSEVKVRVEEKTAEGALQLTVTKLFPKDKFQKKPDKYLKNVSHEKDNGGDESREPDTSEEFEEWLTEIDRAFEDIQKHRKERLNEDFWTL